MRKLKIALIFLVTVALLTVGAVLPRLVAMVTDRNHLNQSGTQEMQSINLDLSGERRALSTVGKIDLLSRGQTINITEKEASMTVAEVNAAVEAAMAEYVDAGIFEWFDITAWNTQPKLCVDPDAPDNYGIFWMVTILNENEPYQCLMMDIDDETGKVFSIRYDIYVAYSLEGIEERNFGIRDTFVHVYLSQLGLWDDRGNVEPYVEYGELDGEVFYGVFMLRDEEYGDIPIEFNVAGPGSFWVYFRE